MPYFEWQICWRHWHLSYKKYEDEDFGIFDNILCIGPLQIKWFSSAIETDK